MRGEKTRKEYGIIIDPIKDGGEMAKEKLSKLLPKCLEVGKIPRSWKNAAMAFLHKKNDLTDLINYRSISCYQLFTTLLKSDHKQIQTR